MNPFQTVTPQLRREPDGHFYWLDLIRFFAAFAVLASHFRGAFFVDYSSLPSNQQTFLTQIFYACTRLGHEAVLVFFVLSGFLVGGKSIKRITSNSFQPYNYAVDRSVRILLPLVSALLLFAVVCLISHTHFSVPIAVGNLLSLQGILCPVSFETLWSLSYEVWFYILMCSVGYIVVRGGGRVVFGVIVFLGCALVFTKLNANYLFIWIIGAFGFYIAPYRSKTILWSSTVLSFVLLVLLQMTSESNTSLHIFTSFPRSSFEVAFGAVFCICLSQVIQYAPTSNVEIKINILGTKLAAFSYTLYLTHIPIRDLLWYLGAPKSPRLSIISVTLYLLWIALAMGCAYAIYWVFERNTGKVKKYVKSIFNH